MHVLSAAPGLRVRHVKHIFETHTTAGLVQQSDPLGSALYPTFELVPHGDCGAGRRVRVLSVNQKLIVHAVFIHPRGSGEKSRPFFRICGNIPRRLFKQRGHLF